LNVHIIHESNQSHCQSDTEVNTDNTDYSLVYTLQSTDVNFVMRDYCFHISLLLLLGVIRAEKAEHVQGLVTHS
jgi:hypothetical protein